VVDAERRLWLETLASACERVLATGIDPDQPYHGALREDVTALLARLRDELDTAGHEPGPTRAG
jgi:hypothetical protein